MGYNFIEKLNWLCVGLGILLGVSVTFGLVYRLGRSFFKRLNFWEDRGAWDRPLPEPIPKDMVVAIFKRRKRYHRHHRHHYQHRRRHEG